MEKDDKVAQQGLMYLYIFLFNKVHTHTNSTHKQAQIINIITVASIAIF